MKDNLIREKAIETSDTMLEVTNDPVTIDANRDKWLADWRSLINQ